MNQKDLIKRDRFYTVNTRYFEAIRIAERLAQFNGIRTDPYNMPIEDIVRVLASDQTQEIMARNN